MGYLYFVVILVTTLCFSMESEIVTKKDYPVEVLNALDVLIDVQRTVFRQKFCSMLQATLILKGGCTIIQKWNEYPCRFMCNAQNDCQNWNDEKTCTLLLRYSEEEIRTGTSLFVNGNANTNYGLLKIFGRGVCSSLMDETTARTACRSMGFSTNLNALYLNHQREGSDFIISDLQCVGSETSLAKCRYKMWHSCTESDNIQLFCLDSKKVSIANAGHIMLDHFHVCERNNRIERFGDFVCSNAFKLEGGRPFYQFDTSQSVNEYSYIEQLSLDHQNIAINRMNQRCENNMVLKVQCAKCIKQEFIKIIEMLKYEGTEKEIFESVLAAVQFMESQCHPWDCSINNPKYPEFCLLKSALKDAQLFLKPQESKTIKIDTSTNYQSSLRDLCDRIRFYDLNQAIFNVRDALGKGIANYFGQLATFDKNIADANLGSLDEWKEAKVKCETLSQSVGSSLGDLLKYAIGTTTGDMAIKVTKLGLAIASAANPLKTLLGGATITDILDAVDDVAATVMRVTRIAYIGQNSLPALKQIVTRIATKVAANKNEFDTINQFFETADKRQEMSSALIDKFLKAYNDFKPAVSNTDIAEYTSVLSTMIDTLCEVVENPETAGGSISSGIAIGTGVCPNIKKNAAIMEAVLTDIAEKQSEVMDSFAAIARAKVAQKGAEDLKKSVESDLMSIVNSKLTNWKIKSLMRARKIDLINKTCDYITYMNFGVQIVECERARANPDVDLISLFNYKDDDMKLCRGCGDITTREVVIPAKYKTSEDGFVNLYTLFAKSGTETNGWSYLTIPNVEWLVKNGWVSKHSTGPFFLGMISLFFPSSSNIKKKVTVSMHLEQNMLNGKNYALLGSNTIENIYTENPTSCGKPILPNPYDFKGCVFTSSQICVNKAGSFNGNLIPRLSHTKWKIFLKADYDLVNLVPNDVFYIKAHIAYSHKKSIERKEANDLHYDDGKSSCCKANEYANLLEYLSRNQMNCNDCPPNSQARLGGYFCEKCSKGYESSLDQFGCTPCRKGYFKSNPGPGKCQACETGKTTADIGASICRVEK